MVSRHLRISLLFVVLMTLAAAASFVAPKANAGNWSDVCCGPACGGDDYCIGSGSFTCCKPPLY